MKEFLIYSTINKSIETHKQEGFYSLENAMYHFN